MTLLSPAGRGGSSTVQSTGARLLDGFAVRCLPWPQGHRLARGTPRLYHHPGGARVGQGEYLQNHSQSCWWVTDFFPRHLNISSLFNWGPSLLLPNWSCVSSPVLVLLWTDALWSVEEFAGALCPSSCFLFS